MIIHKSYLINLRKAESMFKIGTNFKYSNNEYTVTNSPITRCLNNCGYAIYIPVKNEKKFLLFMTHKILGTIDLFKSINFL